jgi:hypothetical protein
MSLTSSHDSRAHRRWARRAAALGVLALVLGGLVSEVEARTATPTPVPTVTATPRLVRVAVAPATAKRQVGQVQNFSVTGFFSDGTQKNFTQKVIYSSSNLNAVFPPNAVGNASLVEAVGVGTAVISVTEPTTGVNSNASNESATMEVVAALTTRTGATPTKTPTPPPIPTATPTLLSLTLVPATAKLGIGQSQSFTVTGIYADGSQKNLTQLVTYGSSNSRVAATPNEAGNKSRVVAVGPGVATITATHPSGVSSNASGGNAELAVIVAPTPTPIRIGATATRTISPTPLATATPILVSLALSPPMTRRGIGAFQSFATTGTFSDGSTKNLTQRVDYFSSDSTVVSAPNEAGNKSKVIAVAPGVATISAKDPVTGIRTAVDSNATFTVIAAPTPTPTRTGPTSTARSPTPTPALPIQTGNPSTACQRDIRRAARSFVDNKLKTLDRCGGAASRCIQRKPNDPGCLTAVRVRCAAALTKLADEEARLITTVIRCRATLSSAAVLGRDGLAYGDIAPSCSARFGPSLTDLTGVAQCLAAQHSCRAETLFALERPRAGELLRLVEAAPDAGACREDFGGGGLGVGDPKGVGKTLERCVQALVGGGAGLVRIRLAAIGRCIDSVFVCVEAEAGNAACLTQATQKCDRQFTRVQREIGTLTVATGKRCNGLDFGVLSGPAGAYLDAVTPTCPSYGIPTVTSIADYVACLVRQHECEVADLVRFESPRADALLGEVGRALVDGSCPQ